MIYFLLYVVLCNSKTKSYFLTCTYLNGYIFCKVSLWLMKQYKAVMLTDEVAKLFAATS
jgi:hypothetical protein